MGLESCVDTGTHSSSLSFFSKVTFVFLAVTTALVLYSCGGAAPKPTVTPIPAPTATATIPPPPTYTPRPSSYTPRPSPTPEDTPTAVPPTPFPPPPPTATPTVVPPTATPTPSISQGIVDFNCYSAQCSLDMLRYAPDTDPRTPENEVALPELADLIEQQPWFKDGVTAEEELFLRTVAVNSERVRLKNLEWIVENKAFLSDTVTTQYRTVKVALIYDQQLKDISEVSMQLVREGVVRLEKILGFSLPQSILTVYVNEGGLHGSVGGNAFVRVAVYSLGAFSKGENLRVFFRELNHSFMPQPSVPPPWLAEGLSEYNAFKVLQELSQNPPQWWQWSQRSFTVADHYQEVKSTLVQQGVSDVAIENLPKDTPLYPLLYTFAGYVLLSDTESLIGKSAFSEIALACRDGKINDNTSFIETATKAAPPDKAAELHSMLSQRIYGK